MTDQSGQEVRLANLSARQAKAAGLMTSGTFGPRGSISCSMASDMMCLSLGSKLQARTGGLGSILYRVTWKHWITPAGRLIPAQRALAHRSSDSASTGWPRPIAEKKDHGKYDDPAIQRRIKLGKQINLGMLVGCAGWPRPKAYDAETGMTSVRGDTGRISSNLPAHSWLTGWPRPQARDHFPPHSEQYIAEKVAQGHGMANLNDRATLAGWPRPTAKIKAGGEYSDPEKAIARAVGPHANDLRDFVHLASHPSPRSNTVLEYRFIPQTIGEMPTGSCVVIPTERVSGPLNPAHSLWLMLGPFATAWARCAERVTLLTSRKPRASSKP